MNDLFLLLYAFDATDIVLRPVDVCIRFSIKVRRFSKVSNKNQSSSVYYLSF